MELRVKMAAVQIDPKIGAKEANLEKMLGLLEKAAQQGARLIAFPECALTGYCFSSLQEAIPLAEVIPGPSTKRLAEVCRRLGVWAVIGLLEADRDRYFNAAVLVGPEGVTGRYRKVHLPYLGIDRFVTPGDEPFRVYETPLGRIGLNICYDGSFPEPARVMTLAGADIIVLPTNWPKGRENVPSFVINARAYENRVHYVAVDRVGQERGFTFLGRSKIVNAQGETLAEAGKVEEETIYAEIDPAQARQKRTVFIPGEWEIDPIGDRRPEFYRAIVEKVASPAIKRKKAASGPPRGPRTSLSRRRRGP